MKLVMNVRGITAGLSAVAGMASSNMANDTREKTVNYIMGNRSRSNPFPKNRVKKNGTYYKNSVARAWPGSPKAYTKPGSPIAISQVEFAKRRDNRIAIGSTGGSSFTIKSPEFVVGPIGTGSSVVPLKLEKGGNTSSFYREVKRDGATLRWEFRSHRPKGASKTRTGLPSPKGGRPRAGGSWTAVNQIITARGGRVGGVRTRSTPTFDAAAADAAFGSQDWKGPKSFRIRPRPYISRAWEKTRKRAGTYIRKASSQFPKHVRRFSSLLEVK